MMAEELGMQRHGQRVVDLEGGHVLDALAREPLQAATLPQRHEHAAMAVWSRGQTAGAVEQQVATGGLEGREFRLLEHEHASRVEAAVPVSGQELARARIGGGAGHDCQGHVAAVTPAHGDEPAEQEFEERGVGNRSHLVQAFGAAAPQS